jgi:MFS family permease
MASARERRRRVTARADASAPFPGRVVAGLSLAMSTGGVARAAVPVISTFLISELEISASQFGLSVTTMIAAVAVGVPVFGQLADRLGARAVLVTRGAGAGLALLGVAISQTYGQLLLSQLVLGIAISGGVPASNRIVAEVVPSRFRGLAIGTKQSGATAGVLVAGILIPATAVAWGWRGSLGLAAGLSVATIPAILLLLPRSAPGAALAESAEVSWRSLLADRSTRWLSAHGLLSGAGIAMVFAFLPLYAVDEVGLTPTAGGAVLSVMAVMAVVSRISWGRFSDLSGDLGLNLRRISVMAVVAIGLIASATAVGSWSLWAGAIVAGLSMEAWGSLAGSGVIAAVPVGHAGRASSVVQLAFMAGNASGPVLFGGLVDATGGFLPGWGTAAGLFVMAAFMRYRPAREAGGLARVEGAEVVDGIEDG